MAKKQVKETENPGASVKQTPGITAGRKRQERRIGSGNARRGSIRNAKAAARAR